MKARVLVCFFLLLISMSLCVNLHAQDLHFSQYTESPLFVNPAQTGFHDEGGRVIATHKSQWMSLGNLYRTSAFSFDMPVMPDRFDGAYLGAGAFLFSDKAGDSKTGVMQAALSVAGIVPLTESHKLSGGIQAGGAQRKGRIDQLQWGSQYDGYKYDPSLPSGEVNTLNSKMYADISTGICYEYSNKTSTMVEENLFTAQAGVALFHGNRPRNAPREFSGERLEQKFVAHATVRKDIPESGFSVVPSVLYVLQGKAREISAGVMARYKLKQASRVTGFYNESALSVGCNYRVGDAVIPQVQLEVYDFGLGISYDVNISTLSEISSLRGGTELFLKYMIPDKSGFRKKN